MLSKFLGPVGQSDISYECPTKNVRVPDQMFDRKYKNIHLVDEKVGWLVLRINIHLAIFQPCLDLEAGDNQCLKIQVARPGIEPRSSCSTSHELNHSATAVPVDEKERNTSDHK